MNGKNLFFAIFFMFLFSTALSIKFSDFSNIPSSNDSIIFGIGVDIIWFFVALILILISFIFGLIIPKIKEQGFGYKTKMFIIFLFYIIILASILMSGKYMSHLIYLSGIKAPSGNALIYLSILFFIFSITLTVMGKKTKKVSYWLW